jgi:hypothetical protein
MMSLPTVSSSRISLPTMAATLVLAVAMLSGAPTAQAAKTGTGICQDLERSARGLCRAAIRSGCALDGRHRGSRHCTKLGSNYRRMTGEDKPVWLKRDDPAPLPGSGPTNENDPVPIGDPLV